MTAGFVGMMAGFTSSVALVFQAAMAAGATDAQISSWLLSLGLGIATTCIGLSIKYKAPILIGWSTPGAALLITSLQGVSMPEAIGAFMVSALLTLALGTSGLFERIMDYIPRPLVSAMLAGILFKFGLDVFVALEHRFTLVFTMILTYLIGKRCAPRYAILAVMCVGLSIAKFKGLLNLQDVHLMLSNPIFTAPQFTFSSIIGVALPLFVVTMTSQNLPGTAVLKSNGYQPPISPILKWLGLTNFLFSAFGCYAICLAAITGAICAGEEADENPSNRYKATIFAGICWVLAGLFGATIVALFAEFPKEITASLAGLAIMSTIGSSLNSALEKESYREPALITILVTASGVSFLGIGSAFWGLLAGAGCLFALNGFQSPQTKAISPTK